MLISTADINFWLSQKKRKRDIRAIKKNKDKGRGKKISARLNRRHKKMYGPYGPIPYT